MCYCYGRVRFKALLGISGKVLELRYAVKVAGGKEEKN